MNLLNLSEIKEIDFGGVTCEIVSQSTDAGGNPKLALQIPKDKLEEFKKSNS